MNSPAIYNLQTNTEQQTVGFDYEFQAALLDLCYDLMSSLELEEILKRLSQHILTMFKVARVEIALLEEGAWVTASRVGEPLGPDFEAVSSNLLAGKGMSGRAFQTGEIVTSPDYFNDLNFEHELQLAARLKSATPLAAMSVPITLDREVVAMVWLAKYHYYDWNAQDLVRAEQLARLARLTIYNSRLYRRVQKLNQELALHTQNLETLQEFNQRLRGPIELEPTASHALFLVMDAVDADGGALFLVDPHNPQELLLTAFSSRYSTKPGSYFSARPTTTMFGGAVHPKQSILIEDVWEEAERKPNANFDYDSEWRSGIFMPLVVAQEIIGVINLSSRQPHHFSRQQLAYVETVATQIAVAVQRVLQIERLKERKQLEVVLQMAGEAAHNLSQPLTVLQIELDLMRQLEQMPDSETLQRLQDALDQLTARVRYYQQLVRY